MADRRAYNHWGDQFVGRTFSMFALATVLLACIGAYGIAAYGVAQRRREIGVRVALGADRTSILRLFLSGGVRIAVAGTLLGLPLAMLTAYGLQSELFGISPWSEPVWIWPGLALISAVVVATWLPAERASRTDPVVALRTE
jgi:ABC-type lipoprotein release transport system permease subunit